MFPQTTEPRTRRLRMRLALSTDPVSDERYDDQANSDDCKHAIRSHGSEETWVNDVRDRPFADDDDAEPQQQISERPDLHAWILGALATVEFGFVQTDLSD